MPATLPQDLRRRHWLRQCGLATVAAVGGYLGKPVLAQGGAATAPVAVPNVPPELASLFPNAMFAGAARLRFWGFEVYDSRLWVAKGFQAASYADHSFALELQYLRSLRGAAIAERSLEEMQRLGTLREDQKNRWLQAMREAFPDVQATDRIVGLNTPGAGVRFWYNGQPRPTVADPEFGRWFFGIWLAENTREPKLRQSLLERL